MGGNIIKQDILIVLSPKENPEQLSSMLASHGFTATTAQNVQTAFEYLKLAYQRVFGFGFGFRRGSSVFGKGYRYLLRSAAIHSDC